jgi:hypothetical protein
MLSTMTGLLVGLRAAQVSQRQQQARCSAYMQPSRSSPPRFGIPVAAMDAPPVAKTDLRPWRSQIEALLVGIAMSPSFGAHFLIRLKNMDFWLTPSLSPRLQWTNLAVFVEFSSIKPSKTSMKTFEVGLSLSSKSCTPSLEVSRRSVNACPIFQHFALQ